MMYAATYFAFGLITYVFALNIRDKTTTQEVETPEWWDTIDTQQKKGIKNILGDISAALFLHLIWPLIIYWMVFDRINAFYTKEEIKFEVLSKHLIEQLNIDFIEHQEMVHDPLNAVPALPFGHLNSNWLKFKKNITKKDKLWSFSTDWMSEWGYKENYRGYVIIQSGKIGRYFLTEIKNVK